MATDKLYRVVQKPWGWIVETKLSYARATSNEWFGITRFETQEQANGYVKEAINA